MSCCKKYDETNTYCVMVQEHGCLQQLKFFVRESSLLLAGTAITIATIQVCYF